MSKTICIVGPTASGKTAISIEIAKCFNGEIISGDSIQVYQELNIGSAKITKEEMNGIVHHLIDIKSCFDGFSAGEFSELTKQKIEEISKRGKTPIIVGGTGLFIKGLIEGYDYSSCPRNEEFRQTCKVIIENQGLSSLYQELQTLNPERAKQISENDQKRIIRALEIEKFSNSSPQKQSDINSFIVVGLTMPREKLYERINVRVDKMVENGLVDEVRALFEKGLDENSQSMKGIGYKELFPYFRGESSLEECLNLIKQHSRNFAKRQITWFRSMPYVEWFENNQVEEIKNYIRSKL